MLNRVPVVIDMSSDKPAMRALPMLLQSMNEKNLGRLLSIQLDGVYDGKIPYSEQSG